MKTPRLTVGLYVNDEAATTLRLVRCLQEWGMNYRSIWRDELADLEPGDVDVLLLHGGWYGIGRTPGQEQYEVADEDTHRAKADAVRRFVDAGGGIVGVCCGAFNVVWLDLIAADISRSTGSGMHTIEVVDETHPIAQGVIQRAEGRIDRRWLATPVIRISGPIFFPRDPASMVFSYDWEKRLGAVLASDYGHGRAVAISPHPERTETEVSAAAATGISTSPLMPVSALLRDSLTWAAGR